MLEKIYNVNEVSIENTTKWSFIEFNISINKMYERNEKCCKQMNMDKTFSSEWNIRQLVTDRISQFDDIARTNAAKSISQSKGKKNRKCQYIAYIAELNEYLILQST